MAGEAYGAVRQHHWAWCRWLYASGGGAGAGALALLCIRCLPSQRRLPMGRSASRSLSDAGARPGERGGGFALIWPGRLPGRTAQADLPPVVRA
jgi:hypothetical protein